MRLVVIGIGAVGGVIGGFLARAKRDVVLVARGAQLAAIGEAGLRVETPRETFVVHPAVVDSPARVDWRDDDVAVLTVKTQDAQAALHDLVAVSPRVPIACATNGVESERLALRLTDAVYAVCVLLPSTYLAPGVVQAWGSRAPAVLDIGRYPEGRDGVAEAIARELVAGGLISEVRGDVMRWKRGKMLWNVTNALEALCGRAARYGELAERAQREAMACFDAAGLPYVTTAELEARSAAVRPQPIAGTARAGGSTWQSLARGARSLETDYLNGEIALLGRLRGVPTPLNALLQRLSAEAARRGAAPGSMSVAEIEVLATAVAS
jgi:2-dehydropantoate 2-reductase